MESSSWASNSELVGPSVDTCAFLGHTTKPPKSVLGMTGIPYHARGNPVERPLEPPKTKGFKFILSSSPPAVSVNFRIWDYVSFDGRYNYPLARRYQLKGIFFQYRSKTNLLMLFVFTYCDHSNIIRFHFSPVSCTNFRISR